MPVVRAKHFIKGRPIKRQADREVRKVWSITEPIQFDFEHAIFHAPDNLSYADIYSYYLRLWHQAMEKIDRMNFKHIIIDKEHFRDQYKPLNNI